MYRAVAWKALHDGLSLDDEDAVADGTGRQADVGPAVVIDGHDVTDRDPHPGNRSRCRRGTVAKSVRSSLARQRTEGESGGVVMEGRDIGSVVFPDADVKVYLDASPEERARRRAADPAHAASGVADAGDVAGEMAARDQSDRTSRTSPLLRAPDAVAIDTTKLSIEQTVQEVLAMVANALR